MYSVGVNEVVPSISKKLSMDSDSLKSSGISLGSTSSLNPSFSSLSSTPSGIAYSNLSGSILSSDLQSPPIAQPFSSYVGNNLVSEQLKKLLYVYKSTHQTQFFSLHPRCLDLILLECSRMIDEFC